MEVSEQARVIAGRYQLESLIGEGGMASVWRARDLTLERPVAVKLLFARDERDQQRLVQQFVREARIAASVHHRNVINIVDFGTTDSQQPFMVMELLEGESLGHRLHREPPLTVEEVVHIASLTLRGLAAVHDAGIIHRDLKPDNVFLSDDRTGGVFPKILDFGISRSVEPRSGRRSALTTREGMIVGTPEYMSPEQARGVRGIDKRTDLYSMGAILYEALTGQLPFASENVGDLIIQIVTATAAPVHELKPDVPVAISEVVTKAMARSVDDRFADAAAMQQALLAAADDSLAQRPRATLSQAPRARAVTPTPAASPAPAQSSNVPRTSLERLRTLEFVVDPGSEVLPARPPPPLSVPAPAGVPLAVPAAVPSAAPPPRRTRLPLALLIAFGLAAGAALLLFRGPGNKATGSLSGRGAMLQAAAPAASPPGAAAVQAPSTITVSLRNVPGNAQVFVDDQPVQGSVLRLARDGRNRVIKVTAPGMVPWQAVHHASADASYEVALVKPAPTPAAPRAASTAAATRHTPATRPKVHKKPPSALRRLDF